MALCLHVATVGADEGGAEAGEQQRRPYRMDAQPGDWLTY